MPFTPIALVGRGCIVPGAQDPDALWAAVADGRDLTTAAPAGAWPVDPAQIIGPDGDGIRKGQRPIPSRGGFVTGFETGFEPSGFGIPADDVLGLDRSVQWLFAAARQAVRDTGRDDLRGARTAVVVGNNTYPTASVVDIAEKALVGAPLGTARLPSHEMPEGRRFWANRFSAGRPAHLLAQALGANGPAFCLDAACASSLYAVKLACDYLQDGTADLAVAGAFCGTDNLFLHLGFSEIKALSPSGACRPLSRRADGLLPAEGAGALVLRRLDDAVRAGDRIHAVIRGIGLSNDGRRGGLLTPHADGQIEALRRAYTVAGLDPATVSLLECHATGTPTGDSVELRSAHAVFGGGEDLPVGSLKSNLGHLLSAAGIAAMIKVAGAITHAIRPPTLHVDEPSEGFEGTLLRPLQTAEPWPDRHRRAGISNFGFGGCNAHLILEGYAPDIPIHTVRLPPAQDPVVICGVGALAGAANGLEQFARGVLGTRAPSDRIDEIATPLRGLRFPPADLKESLGQQTAILEASRAAVEQVAAVEPDRCGVIIGMGCDVDAARPGLRYRLAVAMEKTGRPLASGDTDALVAAVGGLTGASYVTGAMPNLPANRLNVHHDWRGLGYTVASEELSGVTALEIAARALRSRELDMAVVGAVDLSDEPVHRMAAAAVLPDATIPPADAAVAFVLKRRADAEAAGDRIVAIVEIEPGRGPDDDVANVAELAGDSGFGHAHAASALVRTLSTLVADAARTDPGDDKRPLRVAPRARHLAFASFTGQTQGLTLRDVMAVPGAGVRPDAPHIFFTAAADLGGLRSVLQRMETSAVGRFRVAIVADCPAQLEQRIDTARRLLDQGRPMAGPGVAFGEGPPAGDVAFVYPGSAASYPGMGTTLGVAYPEIIAELERSYPAGLARAMRFDPPLTSAADYLNEAAGTTLVATLGTRILRDFLGVVPQAALGLSIGEGNMLAANGVWRAPEPILDGLEAEGFYEALALGHGAIARSWDLAAGAAVDWQNHEIFAPVSAVEEIVSGIPRVWITIIVSPQHCMIGGAAASCAEVLKRAQPSQAVRSGTDLAFHGPFAAAVGDMYRRVHTQPVTPAEGMRFYFNATHDVVAQDADAIAECLREQGINRVDFRPTVEKAWADGVRIFVDIGPRGGMAAAVAATLGDRPHRIVSLDGRKRDGLRQLAEAAGSLFAAGLPVDLAALSDRLARLRGDESAQAAKVADKSLVVAAHLRPVDTAALRKIASRGAERATSTASSRLQAPTTDCRPGTLRARRTEDPPRRPAAHTGHISPQAKLASGQAPGPGRYCLPRRGERPMTPETTNTADESFVIPLPPQLPPPRPYGRVSSIGQASTMVMDMPIAPAPAVPHEVTVPRTPGMVAECVQPTSPDHRVGAAPKPALQPARTTKAIAAGRSTFAAATGPVTPIAALEPEGPSFDRAQLEVLAGRDISSIFGPQFAPQDGYRRQCRMPQPPLLLADRVLGMAGEPGSMDTGICWTETDIPDNAWYLHNGAMPTGLMIEAGQADLLLISWLGVDLLNRDERVYRLLGCEITFHDGETPRAGDTLRFQIHIDAHAKLGDTRMFFFRYDARIGDRLVSSVRSGQAGFFSDEELANSGGVLWSADADAAKPDARMDPAPGASAKPAFTADDVRAFAAGDAYRCFGEGFEWAAAHQRTPAIPSGRMQLIDRVSAFDPSGGPWGRGYLEAECDVPTDAWFYDGHFKNDPCMPGTLMAEAATQALAFHMAALGFTVGRDGWVFRPVTGEAFKFVCRGQVVPDKAHKVTYEVFVEEVIDGDEPTVFAALLASSDGHKVFLCRRFGLQLVRDWPLYQRDVFRADTSEPHIVSPAGDVPGDYKALLACAWGKPSDAFGAMYRRFDAESGVPRLPGPPYHCVSRILSVDCDPGKPTPGGKVVTEFDVDPQAWYFADAGNGAMPFSVLSEVLLQPCGWLAAYMGFALAGRLKFRNLDGTDVCAEREVRPDSGTLTIEATFTKSALAGPMSIIFCDVVCRSADGVVLSLKTDFGFFPPDALASQKGLPATDGMRAALAAPTVIDPQTLLADPLSNDVCAGSPTGRLAMVDAVTGFWPEGGKCGLGRATGRQAIDPSAWYFKAHFYEDPVQPGSLGLEALFNLFKAAVKLKGLHTRFAAPRFEAPAAGTTLGWKYRGQVVPTNKEVITEIDIVAVTEEDDAILVTAEGSLWVDGLRIYEVSGYGLRVAEDARALRRLPPRATDVPPIRPPVDLSGWTIDAATDAWLKDHCPTYCLPIYPIMAVVGDLLNGAGRDRVIALADVELGSWIRLDQGPVALTSKTFSMPDGRTSRQLYRRTPNKDKRIGRAIEIEADAFPKPPAAWTGIAADGKAVDPYLSGDLFHFEAFRLAGAVTRSATASCFAFDAEKALARASGHSGIMLDLVLHGIPHNNPSVWFGEAAAQMAAFPYRLETLNLYAPLPRAGRVTVLSRAVGMPTSRTIRSEVQVLQHDKVVMQIALVEALVPGIYEKLAPADRQALGRDRTFVGGWSVATIDQGWTTISLATVRSANWLPGTLETLYGLPPDGALDEKALTELVALKDHFATRHGLHPSAVRIEDGEILARPDTLVPIAGLDARWADAETFIINGTPS